MDSIVSGALVNGKHEEKCEVFSALKLSKVSRPIEKFLTRLNQFPGSFASMFTLLPYTAALHEDSRCTLKKAASER